MHDAGAAACAQLAHAGPVADAASNSVAALGPGRFFNPLGMRRTRAATAADLERVTRAHATSARLAVDAGFDAVEIHLGHNYLASSFLSPRLNRRTDAYGGSLENRARPARDIARAVREEAGAEIAVMAKFGMKVGVRGGLDVDDKSAGRPLAPGGRLGRRPAAHRGQFAAQSHVRLPRRRPGPRLRRRLPPPLRWGIRLTDHRSPVPA
ncbi:hypothetical protein OHA98_21910 [Streptomyces sp. NBC_00654]|uniref:oxidoreductase n=1 Tax=Streptomyces sp. NBC_00654 TaxID=2975799 RepID=UPI0022589B68|nr:hypothetical protein [Streptomyces sp. NBC_00654]MCX4967370.1 hypothetical protein [Streptomyces sp. NBC_00654]